MDESQAPSNEQQRTEDQQQQTGAGSMEVGGDGELGRYVKAAAAAAASDDYYFHTQRLKKVFQRTFTGSGSKNSTECNWALFKAMFELNAELLEIPVHLWHHVAINCMDGEALKSVWQQREELTSWEVLDRYLQSGPFQQPDSDYSVRTGFYDGGRMRVAKPHQVHSLLRRCETAFAKAPHPMSDMEKIVAVQYNLPDSVRPQVMLNHTDKPYTRYDEFRMVLLTKVNAMPGSSNGGEGSGSGYRGRQQQRHEEGTREKRPRSSSNPRGGGSRRNSGEQQRPQQPRGQQQQAANGDNSHPPCKGCGSLEHQVWWKKDGKPICPNFDPSKVKPRKVHFHKRS